MVRYRIQVQLLRLLRILMILLTRQDIGNLLKLSIALLNVTLVADSSTRSFPSLSNNLLCFFGLVADVRLRGLLAFNLGQFGIVVH